MNGEARKPFSMKYINKELSFVSFSQKKQEILRHCCIFYIAISEYIWTVETQ